MDKISLDSKIRIEMIMKKMNAKSGMMKHDMMKNLTNESEHKSYHQ